MFSIALVGPDGSGKTTIANRLRQEFPVPIKYIYMGTAVQSSNYALPTSRLILRLKWFLYRQDLQKSGRAEPAKLASYQVEYRPVKRNQGVRFIISIVSLVNRLAEEWYRQLVAWFFQLRGYVILFDRHFIFEHVPDSRSVQNRPKRWPSRIHLWALRHFYPRPSLVIFLDASAETMLARKGEWSLEHLRRQREGIIEQGLTTKNFVRVDAEQPAEKVFVQVMECILHTYTATFDTPGKQARKSIFKPKRFHWLSRQRPHSIENESQR